MLLSVICLISGALCTVLGELLLPVLVAVLAALYLFDNNSRRTYSKIISVLLIVMNAVGFVLGISSSVFSVSAILLGKIFSRAFALGQNKADTAYIATLICAAFTVVGSIIFAMMAQGVYTLEAVVQFYSDLNASLREIFVVNLVEIYKSYGTEITKEVIGGIYDAQVNMLISYVFIASFATVGIGMKIFSAIVSRCSEDKTHILNWRFMTTNLFAYFYLIVAIASMFVNAQNSLLAISMLNLYNIFMVIYAYVGFNFLVALISKKLRPFTSFIIVSLSLVLLSSFAIQILAAFGVMFTIRKNNELKITDK